MRDYTIAELMSVCMAREVRDGDLLVQGLYSPMVMVGCWLAKQTHAPHAVIFNVSEGIEGMPRYLPYSTAEPELAKDCVAFPDFLHVGELAARGRLDLVFLSAAQVDMFGNTNLSAIGNYQHPKVRLPGGAATTYFFGMARRSVIWIVKQSRKSFVEKVDFITGVGYLDGPGAREKVGLRWGGPVRVITNLGVYSFDEKNMRMRLDSRHPGVSVEEILANTGFELILPSGVPETPPPTEDQLRLIREIDPNGVRELEFKKEV